MLRQGTRALVLAVAAFLGTQGCAAAGLALVGSGAGAAGRAGTSYTLDSVAYHTFTASMDDTRRATLAALKRMDITVDKDEVTPEGRQLTAQTVDRAIEIELERITARTTRIRVVAKQGWFFRDRATAGEIIAQTERSLGDMLAVSQKGR
jgi:hypothetical protein